MKRALLIVLLTVPAMLFGQDCEQFKTGTFRAKGADGKFIPNYTIERKKNVQVERFGENYTKSKVVWIDDCTYQLIHIKSDALDIPKGTVTTIKIISTFDGGYEGSGHSDIREGTVNFSLYTID